MIFCVGEREANLDESFGDDTMGANEGTTQNEKNSGDGLDEDGEEVADSIKSETPDEQQSPENLESEGTMDEQEPHKEEL